MEKTETQLSGLVEKAIEVAEKTGEFAIEQAPLLLKEFYAWHLISNIMGVILCLIIIVSFIVLFKKTKFEYIETFNEILCIILGVSSISSFIFLCINIYNIVFILVAPKLYLIEYFIK